jgi:hypothetical protein
MTGAWGTYAPGLPFASTAAACKTRRAFSWVTLASLTMVFPPLLYSSTPRPDRPPPPRGASEVGYGRVDHDAPRNFPL